MGFNPHFNSTPLVLNPTNYYSIHVSGSVGKSLQVVGFRWVGDPFGSVGEIWDRFRFWGTYHVLSMLLQFGSNSGSGWGGFGIGLGASVWNRFGVG